MSGDVRIHWWKLYQSVRTNGAWVITARYTSPGRRSAMLAKRFDRRKDALGAAICGAGRAIDAEVSVTGNRIRRGDESGLRCPLSSFSGRVSETPGYFK